MPGDAHAVDDCPERGAAVYQHIAATLLDDIAVMLAHQLILEEHDGVLAVVADAGCARKDEILLALKLAPDDFEPRGFGELLEQAHAQAHQQAGCP